MNAKVLINNKHTSGFSVRISSDSDFSGNVCISASSFFGIGTGMRLLETVGLTLSASVLLSLSGFAAFFLRDRINCMKTLLDLRLCRLTELLRSAANLLLSFCVN